MLREWWNRLRDRLHREALDRELVDELRFHEQMLERDGVPAPRRRLGNSTRIREAARERWSLGVIDVAMQDVRHALRGLIKSPGFSVAVVVTLALGIGANIAMLSITDRLMFRPYPMLRNPSQIHRIYLAYHYRGAQYVAGDGIEYRRYLDFSRVSTTTSAFAAFAQNDVAVGSGAESLERPVAAVSGGYFSFFTARPALGRFFGPSEDSTPRGAAVAVLGYRYWQQQYGGRNVVGQALRVGSVMTTIIGVAPAGFTGISEVAPDVILPLTTYAASVQSGPDYYTSYHWRWLSILVRSRTDVTMDQATADLSRAYLLSWHAQHGLDANMPPAEVTHPHVIVGPLKVGAGPEPGLQARTAVWVLGVAAIVLLIACANVINLFLVRGMQRRRETAVRLALGVSAKRLALLYLVEGLALAIASGVLGLVLAEAGANMVQRYFLATGEPFQLLTDRRTLIASAAVTLVIGLVTAFLPLLMRRDGDLAAALRAGVRGGSRGRARLSGGLLVLQGALSVLLLVGAGLFVRSVHAVTAMRLGYDSNRILVAFINRRGPQLGDSGEIALGRRALEAALAIPGVQSAAVVNAIPFYSTTSTELFVPGIDSVSRLGEFRYDAVRGDYFAAMGTRIVRGRPLLATDRGTTEPVAVVSVAMARTLWPGADAIGKCLRMATSTAPCVSVVGIAENALQSSLTGEAPLQYYVPLEQYDPVSGHSLVIRTSDSPASQALAVRRALQRIMPGEYYVTTTPLAALIGQETRSWHFGATMFSVFGLLALLVAAIGLYALVSYGVAQRTHELGVRVALGAQTADIIRLVVGQGIRFAIGGVALGVGLALVAGQWIQPLLFHETGRDPAVLGAVATVLLAVSATAAMVPALRASRADPNVALRAD